MAKQLLMLVRNPAWFGGVVNFVKSLEENLSETVEVNEFHIGQRKGVVGKWARPFVSVFDVARLSWHVVTNRYDIVHINPSLNARSLVRDGLFLLVLKLRGIRNIVVFIHGWEDSTALAIEKNALLKMMFVTVFGEAPVVYVLAQQFKKSLEGWGVDPENVQVVTTMFDGQQFNGVNRKRSDDEIRVLFLSRFEKEKGVYELLDAFRSLHERFLALKLVLAGTGPEEDAMHAWVEQAGLSEFVTFTGYIRDKEKAQVLLDSDLFVFPTYYGEGCPVSLLEAMAAGLPIVTAKAGGIGDIIVDGKNGRLLDRVTTETVEKAMTDLLGNPEGRKVMGEFNRETAWTRYEAAVISKDIEGMYIRLAESG